jgi:hypothetical protein
MDKNDSGLRRSGQPNSISKAAVTPTRKTRPAAVHVEALYTNIEGARRISGWGTTTIWALIKSGELRVARLGNRGKYAGRTTIEIASLHEAIARRSVKVD